MREEQREEQREKQREEQRDDRATPAVEASLPAGGARPRLRGVGGGTLLAAADRQPSMSRNCTVTGAQVKEKGT